MQPSSDRDAFARGALEGYLEQVKDGRAKFSWDTVHGIGLSDVLVRHAPNALNRAWKAVMDDEFSVIEAKWESLKDVIDPKGLERVNRHLDAGRFEIAKAMMEQVIRDAEMRKEQLAAEAEAALRRQEADAAEAKYQEEKRERRRAAAAGAGHEPDEKLLVDDARLKPMKKEEEDFGFTVSPKGGKKNKRP